MAKIQCAFLIFLLLGRSGRPKTPPKLHLGSLLALFGSLSPPLAPFWLPFCSLLLPFGSPLAHVWVLLAPFWDPSARFGSLLLTLGALWLPLGSLLLSFGSLLLLLVSLLAPSPNTFSQDSLRRLRGGISVPPFKPGQTPCTHSVSLLGPILAHFA